MFGLCLCSQSSGPGHTPTCHADVSQGSRWETKDLFRCLNQLGDGHMKGHHRRPRHNRAQSIGEMNVGNQEPQPSQMRVISTGRPLELYTWPKYSLQGRLLPRHRSREATRPWSGDSRGTIYGPREAISKHTPKVRLAL